MYLLFVLGLLIILLLSGVASYYVWQLKTLKRAQQSQIEQANKEAALRRADINNSIQVIARAFLAGQVESAEACLRLSGLMDQLALDETLREPFAAVDKMAQAIKHIPIKEQWKALTKKQRWQYQQQIALHEKEYKDFVEQSIQALIGADF